MNKELVITQVQALEQQMVAVQQRLAEINSVRNDTLEEVAQAIEHMRCFGQDTIDSFAIYIREMKR
jgi:prefoldin subunit 5